MTTTPTTVGNRALPDHTTSPVPAPSTPADALHDEALGPELERLRTEEQAERDRKAELAKLRDVARFD